MSIRRILPPALCAVAFVFLSGRFCPSEIPVRIEFPLDVPLLDVPTTGVPNPGGEVEVTVPLGDAPLLYDGVDLGADEVFGSYRDNVRDIYVRALKYRVTENSLSFDLPAVTVYMGPRGAAWSDLEPVATIPSVPAGATTPEGSSVRMEMGAEQRLKVHGWMMDGFSFQAGVGADDLVVTVGPGGTLPGGRIKFELVLDFVIYVKPL